MPQNQCDNTSLILRQLANLYINYQFKNIQCRSTQNVDFRLNTMLHGALQLCLTSTEHDFSTAHVSSSVIKWASLIVSVL